MSEGGTLAKAASGTGVGTGAGAAGIRAVVLGADLPLP